MSWSGPVAGAAPYQPQPFIGQPNYGQPQPPQYGQQSAYPGQYQGGPTFPKNGPQQRPPDSRPPKKKGNPIITRYPPPPGYRGPAQPHAPFATATPQYQNPYHTHQQTYPPGPAAPANYSIQGYSATSTYTPNQAYSPQSYGPPQTFPQQPTYPQSGYPQSQHPQYPQQNYAPNQTYPQHAQTYSSGQSYAPPQTSFQGYAAQPAVDSNEQSYVQSQGWQKPHVPPSFPSASQNNTYSGALVNTHHPHDPNATATPTSAHLTTSQSTPTTGHPDSANSEHGPNHKPQLFLAWDDWDFDFEGAIWPKSNEQIDPSLSLGVIIWRPAKQVTRALPSTYDEAEAQALKPAAEKLGNGESVSMYFTVNNSHEAFLDVRQTDEWEHIRHDAVFTVFKDEEMSDPSTLVSLEQCIAERDRPDLALEETEMNEREGDEEMQDSAWNVMDHLEQALSGQGENTKPIRPHGPNNSSRSQAQEDILATLGVTGSPKPASNEPAPFPVLLTDTRPPPSLPERPSAPLGPPDHSRSEQPSQKAHSYAGHRSSNYENSPQRPYGSISHLDRAHPPPPPPPEPPHFNSWGSGSLQNQADCYPLDGSRESPARSEGSNRTLAGSDFDEKPSDEIETTPAPTPEVPQLIRSDSSLTRKRSYDDTDQDDEKLRQQDNHTRRKRRSQVAPAYR
ncbi:hypothetical protein K504DRAFT_380862 [Pleomassaria siparia CBS 279.74]|uniref:Uncharacterized protein n=1 Tax=Pleomassaria siparia CBS 279.74 TaxID=1314801 RepID=A0A6G1K7G6_9PLEO|nr:hypothetical protein K504DRAFT_380862 [Pleomassaria siparia CBS 279.74]